MTQTTTPKFVTVAKWHPLSGSHLPVALSTAAAGASLFGMNNGARNFSRGVANGSKVQAALAATEVIGSAAGLVVSGVSGLINVDEGIRGRFWRNLDPQTYNRLANGTVLGRIATKKIAAPTR